MKVRMIETAAREEFTNRFGGEPIIIGRAPGRANLIGEHTDYNNGFVFPVALDRGVTVALRPSGGRPTKLYSVEEGEAKPFDTFDIGTAKRDDWGIYPAAIAKSLAERWQLKVPNVEGVVVSDLPIGSGLSSSAAIELAFMAAWLKLLEVEMSPIEMALTAQHGESTYVGMKCGVMDQVASAAAREGHAMFVDIRTLEIRYVPMQSRYRIVLCNTNSPRKLRTSEYNKRREECESAARTLGLASLREATLDDLVAKEDLFEPTPFKRARHVITENNRCQSFYWALADSNELRIGLLMRASHESLREDFQVSSKELDAMAESCWSAPGCIGSRMTGAGFGGSCVAIVREEQVDLFIRSVANRYESQTGIEPEMLLSKASGGASAEIV